MRRFTQVAVLLLFALPLARFPGTGLDALRIPLWALLTTLLMGAIVYGEARRSEVRGKFDPLRIALTLFVLVALLSLPGGGTFWSALPPLVVLTLGLISYVILTSPLVSARDLFSWGFPALAVVGIVFSIVVGIQAILDKPVIGTLGNGNRAGALAGMIFPVTLGLAFGSRYRPLYIAASAALLVAAVLTDARGGLLGLAAGSAVALGGIAWRWKGRRGLLMVGAGVLLAAIAFVPLVQKRMETVTVRTGLWKGTVRMALDHPVLGAGIGNFGTEFPPYRTAEEFRISNRNVGLTSFVEAESAHSTWLQIAAETGFPGFLAFLLILYIAVRLWRYFVVHLESRETAAAMAGIGGGVAAFLAAGVTNTLHLHASHFLLFVIFLASIQLIGDRRPHTPRRFAGEIRMALHGVAAFVGVLIIVISVRHTSNENLFLDAMNQVSPDRRIRLLRELTSIDDHHWRAHAELGSAFAAVGHHADAIRNFKRALEERPHHVGLLDRLGVSLARVGGKDPEAEDRFRRASEIAPYYFRPWYNRALLTARTGDLPEALSRFNRSISLRDDFVPARIGRAKVHYLMGNKAAALSDLRFVKSTSPEEVDLLREDDLPLAKDPAFREIFTP